MAGKLQNQSWEEYDEARMKLALEEVRASENLRFFVRYILADMSPLTPMGGSPADIQIQAGRHNAAIQFLGTLDAFDDTLWLDIQREGVLENLSRATPDGGNDVPELA